MGEGTGSAQILQEAQIHTGSLYLVQNLLDKNTSFPMEEAVLWGGGEGQGGKLELRDKCVEQSVHPLVPDTACGHCCSSPGMSKKAALTA